MPLPVGKASGPANAVQSSKRQTYNSTKGEVLLICDEDELSEAQQQLYSEHEEKMKAYKKALDAYNKLYGHLDAAGKPAKEVTQKVAASISCEGADPLQNGVAVQQPKPPGQQQVKPPQQQQVQQPKQHLQPPHPQPRQEAVAVPVAPPMKKTIVAGGTWQPQMVTSLVNKSVMPPTIPIGSNIVTSQQLIPRVVNPVSQQAQRTVIQVPVGTDLSNMQVVNVAGSAGNYQLVVSPQVSFPTLNSTVASQSSVPVGHAGVLTAPMQNILVPVTTTSAATVPVSRAKQIISITKAAAGAVASVQAVTSSKTTRVSETEPINSQAGGTKRSAPEDNEKTKSKKRLKPNSASTQEDKVENYYGWKQGRLWWDDEKPRGSFRCYVCNKKLPTNLRYMQHVKHHLDKEQQQNSAQNNLSSCRSCYKQFKSPAALTEHIQKAHRYCEHRCGICELVLDDGMSLLQHLSTNHPSLQMPYVCGVCNYASSLYDDLILHFNKHHEGSKALMCPFCVRIIKCNNAFIRHCKTHLNVSIKNALFRCRSCKLMFLNNSMLKEHVQEDHKHHSLEERSGIPKLPDMKGKPAEAVPVQKVSFSKQSAIKISPSLWTRREIIKPKGRLRCLECGMLTEGSANHFRKRMSCNRCKYTTYCGTAFANHMIVFHKAGSAPKIHRIRKVIVSNGRILLGCRNCEFSTLSPTLMACHIESCPRGALIIESFKVRTHSLQSSRHYKREAIPVNTKTVKKGDSDDDDVIIIEEEVLVDLTDDVPSTSKERTGKELSKNTPRPTSDKSPRKQPLVTSLSSLTVKLEKLPKNLAENKSGVEKDTKDGNSEDTSSNQEQRSENDEQMEVDKPAGGAASSDNTAPELVAEDTLNSGQEAEKSGVTSKGQGQQRTADNSEKSSKDSSEASKDSSQVVQTRELRIKQEQVNTQ